MPKKIDMLGQHFGMLTVIAPWSLRQSSGDFMWICECSCGGMKYVAGRSLRKGRTRSCGCLRHPKTCKHGHEFTPDNTYLTGRARHCRTCMRSATATTRAKNLEVYRASDRRKWLKRDPRERQNEHLVRTYGITVEEKELKFLQQDGMCANTGCRAKFTSLSAAHTDHNHLTSATRGLLCGRCNQALGFARENEAVLDGLIKYLRTHSITVPDATGDSVCA